MNIRKVLIAGAGTLGGQIAWQVAFSGFDVVVYDTNEESLAKCRERHNRYAQSFVDDFGKDGAKVREGLARLSYTSDIENACRDTDLVSESVPEDLKIKQTVWGLIGKHAPESCIFTTNTSTMVPSAFADASGDPKRFLALHFANPIWVGNVGEVMRHAGTDEAIFERVLGFASEIGMVPIRIEKEQPGYVLNTLLIPMLEAGLSLVVNKVASHEDVDRVWMIVSQVPSGPFGAIDQIGVGTMYNIYMHKAQAFGDEAARTIAEHLKENYLDKGKLGAESGEGFYTYPDPAFIREGFLSGSV